MRILFLGDVVGISGCSKLTNNLLNEIDTNKIDFVIVNGENAASQGVGITKEICDDFFNCGVNVITTGNHVWDQKEIMEHINKEERLLRPKNLYEPAPGKGFNIFEGGIEEIGKVGIQPDLVILSHVIEHIPDLNDALRALKENLKLGSFVYVEVPSIDALNHGDYYHDFLLQIHKPHCYYF